MSPDLSPLEITLQEVWGGGFLIEDRLLSSDFFANSAYFGGRDLEAKLNLKARYVGSQGGSGTYYFIISLVGAGTFECSRCLGDVRIPLSYEGELEVRAVTDGVESFDDEPWSILSSREVLDLGDYLRESLYLSFPMGVVHGDFDTAVEGCDPEMVRYLLQEETGVSLSHICGEELSKLSQTLESQKKKE